jgi:hypothetical protein
VEGRVSCPTRGTGLFDGDCDSKLHFYFGLSTPESRISIRGVLNKVERWCLETEIYWRGSNGRLGYGPLVFGVYFDVGS